MSDFPRINARRADKIVELIQLVATSAASQRATPEEIGQWLAPVIGALHELGGPTAAPGPGEGDVVSPTPDRPVRAAPAASDPFATARALPTRRQLDLIAVLATELEYKLWEKETAM